jgi:hypothetical protein
VRALLSAAFVRAQKGGDPVARVRPRAPRTSDASRKVAMFIGGGLLVLILIIILLVLVF